MARIGLSDVNSLWIEVEDRVDDEPCTVTSDCAEPGNLRFSTLSYDDYAVFSISHEDLIAALIALRDGL